MEITGEKESHGKFMHTSMSFMNIAYCSCCFMLRFHLQALYVYKQVPSKISCSFVLGSQTWVFAFYSSKFFTDCRLCLIFDCASPFTDIALTSAALSQVLNSGLAIPLQILPLHQQLCAKVSIMDGLLPFKQVLHKRHIYTCSFVLSSHF